MYVYFMLYSIFFCIVISKNCRTFAVQEKRTYIRGVGGKVQRWGTTPSDHTTERTWGQPSNMIFSCLVVVLFFIVLIMSFNPKKLTFCPYAPETANGEYSTNRNRCLSVDWLSLYCSCSVDFKKDNANHQFFAIEELPYGTPQFTRAAHIIDTRCRPHRIVAHVQWSPRSNILTKEAVIVKLANSSLYNVNLKQTIDEILSLNLQFRSISRLDLALDFNTFDNGWTPQELILNYFNGVARRKGKGVGSAYFEQSKQGITYTGIQFGSKSSSSNCYLYNKTLELATVKDKPHIRQTWKQNGLDTTHDIWRLEFSFKTEALRFIDEYSGEKIDFSTLENLDKIGVLFWAYVDKHFMFTDPYSDTNVSRQRVIQLFEHHNDIKLRVWNFHNCSNIADRIFIKRLYFANQYCQIDEYAHRQAIELMMDVVRSCDLMDWFNRKCVEWDKALRKME